MQIFLYLYLAPGFPGETEIASPVDPYAFAQPEETDFADQIPGSQADFSTRYSHRYLC